MSVSSCCLVARDSGTGEPSLLQVTVVAGPPEEMQVRVPDAKSYSKESISGIPIDNVQ